MIRSLLRFRMFLRVFLKETYDQWRGFFEVGVITRMNQCDKRRILSRWVQCAILGPRAIRWFTIVDLSHGADGSLLPGKLDDRVISAGNMHGRLGC